jgi:Protein of Unknown function (DUF2784)
VPILLGWAADAVLLAHLAFILLVVLGGVPSLRWPKWAWIHLPAVAWGAWIELSGGICPLTPLENWLLRAAGETGYSGDFIAHYLLPLIYPAGLTHDIQIGLGIAVIALNTGLYGFILIQRFQRTSQPPSQGYGGSPF